jgi:hypothetical protein
MLAGTRDHRLQPPGHRRAGRQPAHQPEHVLKLVDEPHRQCLVLDQAQARFQGSLVGGRALANQPHHDLLIGCRAGEQPGQQGTGVAVAGPRGEHRQSHRLAAHRASDPAPKPGMPIREGRRQGAGVDPRRIVLGEALVDELHPVPARDQHPGGSQQVGDPPR